jgi:Holliday junction resolvasome RuvABC endonuclease subunit
MKLLGVDPGIRGACALIEIDEDGSLRVIAAIDIPTIGTGAKERVNVHAVQEWILQHGPHRAFIERGQAMPRQGASSGFKFGRSVGALEATIALCAVPLEIIEPSMWKRALRLKGKDKEGARQRALEMFPHAQYLLARKMDHQRAEAMLIAVYGAQSAMPVKPAPALTTAETAA